MSTEVDDRSLALVRLMLRRFSEHSQSEYAALGRGVLMVDAAAQDMAYVVIAKVRNTAVRSKLKRFKDMLQMCESYSPLSEMVVSVMHYDEEFSTIVTPLHPACASANN